MKISKDIIGVEPITLDSATEWLQVDHEQESGTIMRLISASRAFVEQYCGLSLVETEITLVWPNYEPPQHLPYGPVTDIESITVDGVEVEPDEDYLEYCDYTAGNLKATYTAQLDPIPADLLQVVYDILKIYYDARSTNVPIPQTLINTLDRHTMNLFL